MPPYTKHTRPPAPPGTWSRVRLWFHFAVRLAAQLVSVAQVLLFLPLTLDIAGKDCMLALSLLLTISFGFSATLHLCVRNTRLRPLSTFTSWLQPLVIPALLLLTLNLYSSSSAATPIRDKLFPSPPSPPLTTPSEGAGGGWVHKVVEWSWAAPLKWETLLRTLSPVFVILEGLCTLLCIQALSRFTLGRIEGSTSPDLLRMLVLILAAGVYVASAYFLWESYGAVPDRISSTLIGVAVTTILFLSGISFSIHKGNVIETSLMLAYAVFQIFHLSSRPQMYTGGLLSHVFRATGTNGHPPLPPVVLQSLDAVSRAVSQTFGAGVEFVMAASSALPFSVLVTLFYRVAVLYAATRIVLNLKRQTGGYEDDRKLSEEEPAARIMTIVLAYARPLLIAVYTHLLVLSSSNDQVFWRWGNVFLVQLLWAIEIRLGQHLDDDEVGVGVSVAGSATSAGAGAAPAGVGGVGLGKAAGLAGVESAAAATAGASTTGGAVKWKGE
ncbi:hypothetical protein JCM10908_002444 [Rhodotorula pacifica]|uniref:Ice2p n=1 Tax=Rhodotorula pacifica TaxID=1495444 RepID=UPI00317CF13B